MPSELDLKLGAILDQLTGPGGRMEIGLVEPGGQRRGAAWPAFIDAPPSLPALYDRFFPQHADSEFIVDGAVRLTFAQTQALARRAARGLIARYGVQRGDRIGIAAQNSASWMIAYLAVQMAGGCAVLLNGWWTGPELAEGVRIGGCRLVLADATRAARLEGQGHGAQVLTIDSDPGDGEAALAAILAPEDAQAALPALGPDDLATIVFTSGSTGTCKGAVSDHLGLVNAVLNFVVQSLAVDQFLAEQGLDSRGRQQSALCQMPLFHVTGEVPVLLQSIVLGRRLVVQRRWDPIEAMRLIEAERLDYFVGVPLMSHELATHPERGRFDLSSCTTFAAGGAARPVEHVSHLLEAFPHARPVLGYGLTETNCLGCNSLGPNYLAKPASTGPASKPLVELAILDEAGHRLPPGSSGEVAIRSIANVLGYWNDPEATARAFRPDGWFLTGDIGYCDQAGYLFLIDRKKDIIIRGGENIACFEVEQAIYAHPAVAEVCVFGVPDPFYGEVPAAVVLPRPGETIDMADLRDFLVGRIAHFKMPACFWTADGPLPRLGSEKIDKRRVKARYSELWEAAKR